MREGTKIFRIFGIDVKLHYTWWFIFILLAWSLATAFFPFYFEGYDTKTYWFMGIVASLLLFVSVLLHELSHSLVAKAKKIKVHSITLFFFGGVAGIEGEDMKPSSEFLMAIAGPVFSLILGGIFYLIYVNDGNGIVTAITFYLYQLNLILAIFNLVPGYPLDGGRAFRAILYAYYKDLRKATAIAAKGGKIFAGVLVVLGIYGLFTGTGGGLWFILIGGFLWFIAGMSYNQVVIKEVLENLKVKDLMRKNVKTLSPQMKFSEFIKNFADNEDNIFFVKDSKFNGVLDVEMLAPVNIADQKNIRLKQVSVPVKNLITVKADESAYNAFKQIAKTKASLVPVSSKSKLVGIVTQRSLANRIAWELKFKSKQRIDIKH
jgi:Zn-dependent protease